MNKKTFLIIFAFLFSFIFLSQSALAWYYSDWEQRRNIRIDNTNNTNTLTDYQVAINLTYDTDMVSDFSDIRFTFYNSTNGTETEIPYWIESKTNSSWAYVWVKIKQIPASGYATVYVYYKNTTVVSSASNKFTTFEFFDDFDDYTTTSVTEKGRWYLGADSVFSVDITNKRLYVNNPTGGFGRWISAVKDGTNLTISDGIIEIDIYNNGGFNELAVMVRAQANPAANTYAFYESTWDNTWRINKRVGSTTYNINTTSYPTITATWMKWKITFIGSTLKFISDRGLTTELIGIDTSFTSGIVGVSTFGNTISYVDNYRVRKFADPEPTYSIGSEEANQPPQITISSPLNQAYWTTNINFVFKVTDAESSTFHVKAWKRTYATDPAEGFLLYDNTSYQNDTQLTLGLTFASGQDAVGTWFVKVWANDTDSTSPQVSELTIYFTIKDYEIQAIVFDSTAYETSDRNFSIEIKYNPDLVSNVSSKLYWNSTDKGYQDWQVKNSTHFANKKQLTLPLIQQNNTQISLYFKNNIIYQDESSILTNSDSNHQNLTYAYWIDDIASDRNDYIEFEDSLINLYVKDKVGKAGLTAKFNFVYNSSYNVSRDLDSYTTSLDTKIFNSTFDVLESFADNENRSYFVNLTVSFQENSRVMNSPTKQLTVYRITLTDCSYLSNTNALTFFVKDEESDNPIKDATIEVTFDTWKTGEIKRNYAWKFYLGNTDNKSICIYPGWAEYTIDSMVQYYKTGYKDRTYYIYAKISNSTTGTNLYLLDEALGNIIVVYVRDENGNPVENAIVKIQRYYVGSNSYKTTAQVKTDYQGKGITFLRVNEIYYRFIIEKNFIILIETNPTIITCVEENCPPYHIILSISEQKPAEYFQYLNKIAYACSVNEDTNILRCTVSDTSQLMQKARLLVEKKGALKFDSLCDNVCESSACTLTCDLGNRTNNLYRYQLLAYISETPIILKQDLLDYLTGIIFWGSQGLLMSFLITSTLFFVGIWNPTVSLMFGFVGIIAGYSLGMLPVSISSLIGLGLAIAILIYKTRS